MRTASENTAGTPCWPSEGMPLELSAVRLMCSMFIDCPRRFDVLCCRACWATASRVKSYLRRALRSGRLTQDPFQDAFIHLPNLRARVTPPEKSRLRLTPEAFAALDERARLAGQPANWRLSDQVLEDSRRELLGNHPIAGDLWVYSYGSLMWDPASASRKSGSPTSTAISAASP